jgi:hypothetical protein
MCKWKDITTATTTTTTTTTNNNNNNNNNTNDSPQKSVKGYYEQDNKVSGSFKRSISRHFIYHNKR